MESDASPLSGRHTAQGRGHGLIVEDNQNIRAVLTAVLLDEGYTVAQAPDGAAALVEVGHQRPDVVLPDMHMPVLDGSGFARAYRALSGPHAPIVVMTATRDAAARAAQVAADATLPKPFVVPALLETVAQFCRPAVVA